MTITLDEKYNAKTDIATLGYVGETNARIITFEGYQCEDADSYKMRFKYADGVTYDVDISDGTYTIDGSILRIVGAVYVQIFACRHNGDNYEYVKKSNILTMHVDRSLNGNVAPVPPYEKSAEALEKVLELSKKVDGMSNEINTAITNANTANNDLQSAIITAKIATADVERVTTNANTTKAELDTAITNANAAKSNLGAAQTTAETALSDLNTAIAQAKTSDSNLASTINDSETAKTQLSEIIENADSINTTLAGTISAASNLYTSLSAENLTAAENIAKLAAENASAGELHMKADGIVCEAEGAAIVMTDSSDLPFNGVRVFGRSKQFATTGAQLLNPDLYDTANTRAGVTANVNSDGSITLTGTTKSTDQYAITYFLGEYIDLLEDGKEYSINTGFRIVDNGAVRHATKIIIKPTITSVRPYVQVTVADYTDGMTIYPMFNSGNTVAEWEPCTGGIPSPNPDYPQEIVSVGDSDQIIVTVSDNTDNVQALTVSTPNGLPGIPVDSGGNYTDGNGQQWICDEIDLGRGVYVKRIHEQIFNGTENWEINATGYGKKYFMLQGACKPNVPVTSIDMVGLCQKSKIVPHRILDADDGYGISYIYFWRCNFAECDANNGATVSDLKSFLSNNPMTIFYAGISIETPLSAEEISAYKSLHTNKPTTTITNSDSAHMAVSYTADTKTYIDNKFAELQTAIISTGGNI